uniref:Uncharacterized protein n=1 Tax=Arundo donax TaxID=35708 RepID=A0A0A9E4Y0_ARUDO
MGFGCSCNTIHKIKRETYERTAISTKHVLFFFFLFAAKTKIFTAFCSVPCPYTTVYWYLILAQVSGSDITILHCVPEVVRQYHQHESLQIVTKHLCL